MPRLLLATVLLFSALVPSLHAQAASASAPAPSPEAVVAALVRQNDEQVAAWLVALPPRAGSPREAGRLLKMAAAAYTHPQSRLFKDAKLGGLIERLIATMEARQNRDGSFDAEFAAGNPQSPPDGAFVVRHLALAQALLRAGNQAEMRAARERLDAVLERSALVLRSGGVHTPNHRWVICSALSFLQTLQPTDANVARIDDWLGEGIDQDPDGQFSERSSIYSAVTAEALLDLAVNLRRPELLDAVRRNLQHTLLLADADGELEVVASRRQDQQGREPRRLYAYYLPLRYLALTQSNGVFAHAVQRMERDELTRLTDHLPEWMVWSELRQALTASRAPDENFAAVLPHSGLARIRRGPISASIFGGSDWAQIRDISSGLATNPTFFRFRKGAAVLDSVRLTNGFFNLGYVRSEGLEVLPNGGGYRLWQTQRAAYYQPLPPEHRRPDGQYALTDDGRFYSKMDFPHRPRDERQLRTEILIKERPEKSGEFELEFSITGTDGIGVILELAFRPGGTVRGAEARAGEPDTYLLKSGTGAYQVGQDTIEFGPGSAGPTRVSMAGEDYSWRNGQLRTEPVRVYVTGVTPFKHTLRIR